MGKLGKIITVIAGIVIVLFIALVVLAKVVITPERVKDTVLPIAEKSLQRKIELGDISVSIFSGIELQDLKIYEDDGKELFVSTDLVRLKYQLLPLLAMKVVVDEVTVVEPAIKVARLEDGSFSFDDIIRGDSSVDKNATGVSSGSSPINLLVSTVNISNGSLLFTDHQVSPGKPFRHEIRDLQVAAKGITLTGSIPVSISCNINGGVFSADGSISLSGPVVDLNFKLNGVDVVTYSPYFKDAVPGELTGLNLTLDAMVSGSTDKVSVVGNIAGSGLDLTLDAIPNAPFVNSSVKLDYDLGLDLENGALDLRASRLDFNGLVAEAAGSVRGVFETPQLDLRLSVPALDLQKAIKSIPEALVKDINAMRPGGLISASAKVSGAADAEPKSLLKSASLVLDNVQVSSGGQKPGMFGKLSLSGDVLESEDMEIRLGDNRARIDLKASNLFGKVIVVKADITSEQFLLDPLLGAGGGAGSVAGDGASGAKGEEIGPFEIPIQAAGVISIGKTIYKGLSIDKFIARYKLQDNILTISQLDGSIAGGAFANSARVDLGVKGLAYNADIGVKAIQADPLVTAFIPNAAGALLGAMNFDFNIKGRGTQWETMNKNLTGLGDLFVSDGRLVSPGLVKRFASFLQLSNIDEISFEDFKGNLRVENGKIKIDSSISSDEIKLFPEGTIGLDGSMNLTMDTRLSPEVAGRLDSGGSVTKYLTDEEGWSQIPLLVSGTYASPSFGLDSQGIQKQATKVIGKEIGKQINKLLGEPQPKPGDQQEGGAQKQPVEDPASELLKEGLKGIFGN